VPRTRVKICGITNIEDANHAVAEGADAIGFVFYESSPRNVSIARAGEITPCMPAFVSAVGLFVDADEVYIREVLESVDIDILQFHGDESEVECLRYGLPYIKAIRVKPGADIKKIISAYPSAKAILLDTYHATLPGGTGEKFDWSRVPIDIKCPIILAGGLNALNVGLAIAAVSPYAVDVSGGVEITKGKKDPEQISAFFNAVNIADKKLAKLPQPAN
jgi:phosphoribosylanthranilate isomerase